MENKFKKPEAPFLLLTEDMDGIVSYYWWDNEKKMQEDAVERRGNGERIVCAIEISSCRDVEIPIAIFKEESMPEDTKRIDDSEILIQER